ncbi:Zonadhesin Precursor [Collichthys lucidus]|uniref:Zonadhesin n=1 Tax=Collichthys lucidus TaxID=240159 RepID=A0A4U5ULM4_COLLU|nr:Zonadhesin Precursor [Collichthys lucidus]
MAWGGRLEVQGEKIQVELGDQRLELLVWVHVLDQGDGGFLPPITPSPSTIPTTSMPLTATITTTTFITTISRSSTASSSSSSSSSSAQQTTSSSSTVSSASTNHADTNPPTHAKDSSPPADVVTPQQPEPLTSQSKPVAAGPASHKRRLRHVLGLTAAGSPISHISRSPPAPPSTIIRQNRPLRSPASISHLSPPTHIPHLPDPAREPRLVAPASGLPAPPESSHPGPPASHPRPSGHRSSKTSLGFISTPLIWQGRKRPIRGRRPTATRAPSSPVAHVTKPPGQPADRKFTARPTYSTQRSVESTHALQTKNTTHVSDSATHTTARSHASAQPTSQHNSTPQPVSNMETPSTTPDSESPPESGVSNASRGGSSPWQRRDETLDAKEPSSAVGAAPVASSSSLLSSLSSALSNRKNKPVVPQWLLPSTSRENQTVAMGNWTSPLEPLGDEYSSGLEPFVYDMTELSEVDSDFSLYDFDAAYSLDEPGTIPPAFFNSDAKNQPSFNRSDPHDGFHPITYPLTASDGGSDMFSDFHDDWETLGSGVGAGSEFPLMHSHDRLPETVPSIISSQTHTTTVPQTPTPPPTVPQTPTPPPTVPQTPTPPPTVPQTPTPPPTVPQTHTTTVPQTPTPPPTVPQTPTPPPTVPQTPTPPPTVPQTPTPPPTVPQTPTPPPTVPQTPTPPPTVPQTHTTTVPQTPTPPPTVPQTPTPPPTIPQTPTPPPTVPQTPTPPPTVPQTPTPPPTVPQTPTPPPTIPQTPTPPPSVPQTLTPPPTVPQTPTPPPTVPQTPTPPPTVPQTPTPPPTVPQTPTPPPTVPQTPTPPPTVPQTPTPPPTVPQTPTAAQTNHSVPNNTSSGGQTQREVSSTQTFTEQLETFQASLRLSSLLFTQPARSVLPAEALTPVNPGLSVHRSDITGSDVQLALTVSSYSSTDASPVSPPSVHPEVSSMLDVRHLLLPLITLSLSLPAVSTSTPFTSSHADGVTSPPFSSLLSSPPLPSSSQQAEQRLPGADGVVESAPVLESEAVSVHPSVVSSLSSNLQRHFVVTRVGAASVLSRPLFSKSSTESQMPVIDGALLPEYHVLPPEESSNILSEPSTSRSPYPEGDQLLDTRSRLHSVFLESSFNQIEPTPSGPSGVDLALSSVVLAADTPSKRSQRCSCRTLTWVVYESRPVNPSATIFPSLTAAGIWASERTLALLQSNSDGTPRLSAISSLSSHPFIPTQSPLSRNSDLSLTVSSETRHAAAVTQAMQETAASSSSPSPVLENSLLLAQASSSGSQQHMPPA